MTASAEFGSTWNQALELLAAEKDLTLRSDEPSRQRRSLLWVRVEGEYIFDAVAPVRSTELFDGRRQLLVYHFTTLTPTRR